jgi:hypothetical protein
MKRMLSDAKRLVKRASAPAPSKTKEASEPDVICKGAESVATTYAPALGFCTKCKMCPANSEGDHLCLRCHKEANGFEFDAEKNRFVKIKGRK